MAWCACFIGPTLFRTRTKARSRQFANGLKGGADFYAADVKGLKAEGEITLRVFLEACEQRGIEPRKHFSGKFSLRVDPATHEAATIAAAAQGQSLNQWATEAIRQAALTH